MSIHTSTANGAVAMASTGNACVNLFFNIGAARNNPDGIINTWESAYLEDNKLSTAIVLWARDIRHGGAGERQVFRTIVKHLVEVDEALANRVVQLIPKIGRFDDLHVFYGTDLQEVACKIWAEALTAGNAIAYKWANRSDKVLRDFMGLKNEAAFRKFISKGRKGTIVESKMCSGDWSAIEYGKLPSVAGARYAKAFKKNDEARYTAFISVKDTTVNTKALFPHDVYRAYKYGGQADAASKYWDNLPKLDVAGNILVMPDVSGSMRCACSGKIQCIDVAVSLGAYLAQQIKGYFHNSLITFSNEPTLVKIPNKKDIQEIFSFVEEMDWGGSTNFEGAFEAILHDAILHNVPQSEMPSHLLVLSDMQFNPTYRTGCDNYYDWSINGPTRKQKKQTGPARNQKKQTVHKDLAASFKEAGYEVPKVIYWNLNGSYNNFPTVSTEEGACLVSGFSPAVLKAILAAKEFTPRDVMLEAVAPFLEMLG